MPRESLCGFQLEDAARARGARRIAGVDEVGRGPLFGPVVAAAVILAPGCRIEGLTDSKKLTEKRRTELDQEIRLNAVSWAIAEVDAETIDRINIRRASLEAMRRAVAQLPLSPDFLLIDGRDTIAWECAQQAVIGGDGLSLSIAAASVLAKVYRDRLLVEYDRQFPGYGLARHKGYGTPDHLAALARLGPTPLHRRSFHPVTQSVLDFDPEEDEEFAEAVAAAAPESGEPAPLDLEIAPAVEPPALRHACPCCGYLTLPAPPPGTFAHCEVCWWEDDPIQFADPAYEGGANAPSLHQARAHFAAIAVSDPHLKGHERPPRPEEIPPVEVVPSPWLF
ncbi:MAG: ribonuclease HII [Terracidiphilus sp.]